MPVLFALFALSFVSVAAVTVIAGDIVLYAVLVDKDYIHFNGLIPALLLGLKPKLVYETHNLKYGY